MPTLVTLTLTLNYSFMHLPHDRCTTEPRQSNATGDLMVSCNECSTRTTVTATLVRTGPNKTPANSLTFAGGNHCHDCSLYSKCKQTTITNLPSLGHSITVYKGSFTIRRI